jgi:isoleucyl-tRNA synthetase
MRKWMPSDEARAALYRTLDIAARVLTPILVAMVGYVFTNLVETQERLSLIERDVEHIRATRYTSKDAQRDRTLILDEIRAALEPLREDVREIRNRIDRVTEENR